MSVSVMTCVLGVAVACFVSMAAAEAPSCEGDTAAHCLGDDADMSAEGITACLEALGAQRSPSCTSYLALLEGCADDISGDGACAKDHANGDTMPCLLERSKPETLSAKCQAALPKKKASTARRDTFWKEGKRLLTEEEEASYAAAHPPPLVQPRTRAPAHQSEQ